MCGEYYLYTDMYMFTSYWTQYSIFTICKESTASNARKTERAAHHVTGRGGAPDGADGDDCWRAPDAADAEENAAPACAEDC
jgi:hypothetical protein